MTKENINSKKGFTIIEVVLVLAIAGLIFLMVFVALPALQRSQRDTQRRDDMARFLSQLSQRQSNNSGRVPDLTPAAYQDFIDQYLRAGNDTFTDPSTGNDYHIISATRCTSAACNSTTTSNTTNTTGTGEAANTGVSMGEISVYSNARCEGESPVYVQGDRKIAITLKLEGAGVYCGNN